MYPTLKCQDTVVGSPCRRRFRSLLLPAPACRRHQNNRPSGTHAVKGNLATNNGQRRTKTPTEPKPLSYSRLFLLSNHSP
ncbi:hypothetical protein K432DRAFT_177343 [Lepidopterella palustris CBS 459.81]|uniref:Uncharacterized protein n=1 Tax=Lepidopterella palustris CBS 459.81 TaxID=1314670 RepID=A0A8E2JAF3_9PEZI|nr:hypothetical protein K432DRAFT_177343 [Lepidopterella palustris CBS 459.81]